jgi:Cu2+-exporting ATPase
MMAEEGVEIGFAEDMIREVQNGVKSVLCVAVEGKLVGVITYADRTRRESANVISQLRALGVGEIIMLTGDRGDVALATAAELGIDKVYSEVFPEKKLEIVRGLRNSGRTVAVVGDGINDSLALAKADVSVAPAGATDAAKEASDVLLMEDDLRLLVEAFAISKSAIQLVRQNYGIVAMPNAAALALAAGGLLGPAGATFINNGSTVVAGLNGLRPLLIKDRKSNGHRRTSGKVLGDRG